MCRFLYVYILHCSQHDDSKCILPEGTYPIFREQKRERERESGEDRVDKDKKKQRLNHIDDMISYIICFESIRMH